MEKGESKEGMKAKMLREIQRIIQRLISALRDEGLTLEAIQRVIEKTFNPE